MKNKIHKILGVGITLVIAMALVMGFAAPAAASPGETINEWYPFTYPGPGADDGWFYDPSITRVGEITEAIDGTLYVHVQRILDADPTDPDYDNFYFDIPSVASDPYTGTLTISEEFPPDSDTAIITASIDGDWDGPERDFTACLDLSESSSIDGSLAINGTLSATGWTFKGSIENLDDGWLPDGTWPITDGAISVSADGFSIYNGWLEIDDTWDWYFNGGTDICSFIFKSTDGGRTWEETDYTGGWVVDMAASSLDADSLYVADSHYAYKTADAGDSWSYVKKDSLEEQLAGACGVPATCCYCGDDDCDICPSCDRYNDYDFSCPITSIDVAYDDNDNPYVFIGTRKHCSGLDLDDDGNLDEFPGEVYWIGEGGFPSNWSGLGLCCYRSGTYDALAVGCAPNWADTNETYVVVSTDDDDGNGDTWDPGDCQTHVVSTTGGPCDWPEYAELKWDCVTPFASAWASRIAFPDDWEDTETLFVGVVDCDCCDDCYDGDNPTHGCGGDVYMVMDGSALDMNVLGISSGCIGLEAVDIISLDIEGDTEEARLIAGASCDNNVYCSEDGGWSWDASDKDPTGEWGTYAIWYEDTALAATAGCECAVSMCCGEDYPCEFWNQISLIRTDIDAVRYLGFSPGYVCEGSETMFLVTWCMNYRGCDDEISVFRHDGTYWERVFCSITYDAIGMPHWRLQVSPDFNTTNCVYLVNAMFEIFRTTDAGCSWDPLTFPCEPRPEYVTAIEVIDEDTVILTAEDPDTGDPKVYKTTRHGARPWKEYDLPEGACWGNDLALEPGYEDPGTIILGDRCGHVYISEDGGETWDLVDAALLTDADDDPVRTWVEFDPGYATNHIIYAATGCQDTSNNTNVIARCIIDPDADWADQKWETICSDEDNDGDNIYWGIEAVGDTVLYVIDADEYDEPHDGGVLRSLNPDAEKATDAVFERANDGLTLENTEEGSELRLLWITCDTSDEGCTENVLWSTEHIWTDGNENVWVYEDTLAAPVILNMPLDGQKLTTTNSVTLSWNALCGADCYEVALWKYCPECPDERLDVPLYLDCAPGEECIACAPAAVEDLCACPAGECACTSDICIVVGPGEYYYGYDDYRDYWEGLEPGTTYYWQVRVCLCQPFLSKWSEERTFMTALVPVVDLCSPVCGGQDIILTPNFSWDAVEGASGYDIELATTETFTAGVVRGSSTVNAWVAPEDLEYATTYYWRVRAEKDGVFSDWTVCIFTTMAEPVAPTPPVTITPAPPAPQINIPPAKMITPNWIYAIIAIGAALCVVVIVLIVRTRRPPA